MPKQINTARKPAKRTARGAYIDFAPRKRVPTASKATKTPKITPKIAQKPLQAASEADSDQIAVIRRKTPKAPKIASKREDTSVKINFGPKKAADLDLEDVFDELEAKQEANPALFDDYQNPLDVAQKNFIAEPEPEPELELELELELEPEDSEQPEQPKLPRRNPNSPFLASVTVDKRPLSGGIPANTATESNLSVHAETTTKTPKVKTPKNKAKKTKAPKSASPQPTTVISAAPSKVSSTIGLLIAILVTVIAGGFVGALIYFLFFQE